MFFEDDGKIKIGGSKLSKSIRNNSQRKSFLEEKRHKKCNF